MKRFSQLTQTATETDLVAENFLAIDVPGVGGATKKVPGNLVASSGYVNRMLTTKTNVFSPVPTPNFGTWQLGSFNSSLQDTSVNNRCRTQTFTATSDIEFTFHIPAGYKLFIWTNPAIYPVSERVFKTADFSFFVKAGIQYRIAIAKTDDSNLSSVYSTLWVDAGFYVYEEKYSANVLLGKIEDLSDSQTSESSFVRDMLPTKANVLSPVPTPNFGPWEIGTFGSDLSDLPSNNRCRTQTFTVAKDTEFTFHIPSGYKIFVWMSPALYPSTERAWRTEDFTFFFKAGTSYRIALSYAEDADLRQVYSTFWRDAGYYVYEDKFASSIILSELERFEKLANSRKGVFGNKLSFTSRHLVCLTDGFEIVDKMNRAYVKKLSNGYARCKVGILGKPSSNYKLSFRLGNPDYPTGASGLRELYFKESNGTQHVLKHQRPDGYYSPTWYLDGTDTGACWYVPITFSYDGTNTKITVSNGEPIEIFSLNGSLKNIWLEFYMNESNEVFVENFSSEGYAIELHTTTLPFPFTEGVAAYQQYIYAGYWNPAGKLEVYMRNMLDGTEDTKTFNDIDLTYDSHNYVALGIDASGCIHVACNCHGTPLVYLYGQDLDSLGVSNKLSYSVATYPAFWMFGGKFYATYREGSSGSGRFKIYVYDEDSKTFSATTDTYVARGDDPPVGYNASNPYFAKWVIDENGGWAYNTFVWRDSGDNTTNHDFFAVKTNDFEHFYNLNGDALTLPIDQGNCSACQLDELPYNSGLLNQQTNIVIVDSVAIALNFHYDENGNENLYAYRLYDGAVHKFKISELIGTDFVPVCVQANIVGDVAKVIVYTTHGADRQNGSLKATIYFDKDLNFWVNDDVENFLKSEGGKIHYFYNGKLKAWQESYCFYAPYGGTNYGKLVFG